jgi:uncharacterized membrane protein YebE (DUF533 family)
VPNNKIHVYIIGQETPQTSPKSFFGFLKRREKILVLSDIISLAHGDGDIDAKVAVVSKELSNAGVEDEAVRIQDGGGDAFVNGARCRLPRQPPSVSV